ncbi:MAG: LysR family transcriptional regulator [Pseudomonadales bacterium]|nr:LysR family transcriptional regulator [Pseudomonadales bacterium]
MKSRLHAHIGTFRQLELLLAVYETGSIKRAAEKLYLAQPTVSMQLKKLADAIGMPLYDQVGKKLVFTEAGGKVYKTARQVMESIDNLDMELAELRGLRAGSLKLAVVTSSKYFAPHLMGAFSALYPGIDVQLKVGNREKIIDRLVNDEDDFYIFSHLPEDVETNSSNFLSNPLVAIAHKKHPLAKKKSLSLDDICKEFFIAREPGSGTRYAIDQYMSSHGKQLDIRMTIESNEAIKHAVISGLGISILSAHSLAFTDGSSEIVKLNVEGFPIKTAWHFAWSKKKALSPIAKEFALFLGDAGTRTITGVLKKNRFI